VVELRDLFHATPARLKFLRTDRAEAQAIAEVVRAWPWPNPPSGFTLTEIGRRPPHDPAPDPEQGDLFDALHRRLTRMLGADFTANALRIDAERDGLRWSAMPRCPPIPAAPRPSNTCSSTAARSPTGCCWARCAPPISTCCRATATRRRC
jgi:DNA mismatch repair protein MutL